MKNKMIKKLAAMMAGIMVLTCVPMQNLHAEDIVEQDVVEQGDYENLELTFDADSENQSEKSETSEFEEAILNHEKDEEKNEEEVIPQEQNETEELISELNYLFVNKANVELEEKQSFVVSWGKENSSVDKMELVVENEQRGRKNLEITKNVKNMYLFEDIFEKGIYHIAGLKVVSGGEEKEYTAKDLKIEAYFGVEEEYQGNKKSDYIEVESITEEIPEVEANIVMIDDKGTEKTVNTVKEALDAVEKGTAAKTRSIEKGSRVEDLVIVLDPGHDSKHAGVQKNGVKEEIVSLKIAQYCKAELEKYSGVTVYLTREGAACPFPTSKNNIDDIIKRTDWAKTKKADVFISFHINSSTASSANGAEVYYPKGDKDAKKLAEQILGELKDLGIHNRGEKESTDYAVVKHSVRNGFPGFIIEHAFVSNSSDVKWFKSEENLKKLGIADATGIAEYYKLNKDGNGWIIENGEKYYYVNKKKVLGEKKIDGKWYLFDEVTGAMKTGLQKIEKQNKTVYYGPDGAMRYGEQKINKKWYLFDEVTGAMKTGLQKIEKQNKTVYYGIDGAMRYGEQKINGKWYLFDEVTGAMKTGLQKIEKQNKTVYYGADGAMRYGEQKINKKWYLFDEVTGAMKTGLQKIEKQNKTVYYGADGAMRYGEQKINGKWYCFNEITGAMIIGWHIIEKQNKIVYYDEDGSMVHGEKMIDNKLYMFDKVTGALLNENGGI